MYTQPEVAPVVRYWMDESCMHMYTETKHTKILNDIGYIIYSTYNMSQNVIWQKYFMSRLIYFQEP